MKNKIKDILNIHDTLPILFVGAGKLGSNNATLSPLPIPIPINPLAYLSISSINSP